MAELGWVYVDADYLKELEEKSKKVDYYQGIIDGITMCKDIADTPQTEQPTALSNALKEFKKDAEWLEQVGASSISLEEYKQRTWAILKKVDYNADTPQTNCGRGEPYKETNNG